MLASRPGLGKSRITMYFAMCAAGEGSPGAAWPNGDPVAETGPVIMIAFEDDPAHTLRPIYNALGGPQDVTRITVLSDLMLNEEFEDWTKSPELMRLEAAETFGVDPSEVSDVASPEIAEAALDAAYGRDRKERQGARDKLLRIGMTLEIEHQAQRFLLGDLPVLWIVDPLANLTSALGLNENSNPEMNSLFRFLSDLADRYNVALLVVHHNRKPSADGDAVFDQRGASAITAAVRSQIALDRGLDDQRIMGLVKANWAAERGVVTWAIHDASRISGDENPGALFEQPAERDVNRVALVPVSHNDAMTFDIARARVEAEVKARGEREVQTGVQRAIIEVLRESKTALSVNALERRIEGWTAHRLRAPIAALLTEGAIVEMSIGKSRSGYAVPRSAEG